MNFMKSTMKLWRLWRIVSRGTAVLQKGGHRRWNICLQRPIYMMTWVVTSSGGYPVPFPQIVFQRWYSQNRDDVFVKGEIIVYGGLILIKMWGWREKEGRGLSLVTLVFHTLLLRWAVLLSGTRMYSMLREGRCRRGLQFVEWYPDDDMTYRLQARS